MPNFNIKELGIIDADFEKSKNISYPTEKVPPQGNLMLNKVKTIKDTLKQYRKKVY